MGATKMKLYEIAENYTQLIQMADNGELSEQSLNDTLESLGGEFKDKAKNCMMLVKQFEGNQLSICAEIDRLLALKSNYLKSSESIKDYIKNCMTASGQDKLDLGLFKLTLKKPSKVADIISESEIPDKYWRDIPASKKLDKASLLKDLKVLDENETISGAKLCNGKRALLIK
jgi:hypothetical protein